MTKINNEIELLGGHKSPDYFYEAVEMQIESRLHELKANKLYTSKILCGDEFWEILKTDFCRRLAGRCLAHMVHTKRFPFKFIQYKRYSTKYYRLH